MVDTMTYEELIKQAEENYNVHSYQQAIDCATLAIELDKTKPDGYYWRGIACRRQEERMNKRFRISCYRNGISLTKKYQNEIEAKDTDSLLKCKPETATHFAYRGWAYVNQGEFVKAIENCDKAIRIEPNNAVAYFHHGKAHSGMKNFASAIENYSKAIDIAPDFSDVYYNRGIAYFFEHNYDKAMADFDKAIEIDPDDAGAYFSRYFTPRDIARRQADLSKAIEIVPNNDIVYLFRGTMFLINEDYDHAIQDFDEAIRIDPKWASAYSLRGSALCKQNNYNEAILDYAEAVKLDPKNARHIFNFLDAAKTENIDIKSDTREKLRQSPDYLISLVGNILCVITNKACYLPYIHLIHSVHNLLSKIEENKQKLLKEEPDKLFYQYRSSEVSLDNIRERGTILLTPACFANDSEEGTYIYKYISSLKNTRQGLLTLSVILNELVEEEDVLSGSSIAFIRSFSESEDHLSMWNSSYAANGKGYSVGSTFSKLKEASFRPLQKNDAEQRDFSYPEEGQSIQEREGKIVIGGTSDSKKEPQVNQKQISLEKLYFSKVLYLSPNNSCPDDVKDEWNKIEQVLTDNFNDYFFGQNPGQADLVKRFFPQIFLPISHLIKSADFDYEKEWRLLYYTTVREDRRDTQNEGYVQYKSIGDDYKKKNLFIETKEILFTDKNHKEVIYLGPKFDEHLTKARIKVQLLFEYVGKDEYVEVRKSDKHFR